MADSPDFTKKILVDVELKSEQLKKDLPALTSEIDRLTTSQKAAQKAGETSTKAYIDNASQLRNLKSELRDTNKYIDNVSKAVNAQTGSIQQNRAVLSVITSDYVKVGEKSGVTAKQINVFTDALKAQEKQIGQTYRNVGNYEGAIDGLLEKMGSSFPIFKQFQEGFKTVSGFGQFLPGAGQGLANGITSMFSNSGPKQNSGSGPAFTGFKQFGNESKEATEAAKETEVAAEGAEEAVAAEGAAAEGTAGAMTGLGVAMTAVLGVFAALLIPLAGLIEYLKDVAGFADGLSNNWAGLKASTTSFFNTLREGDLENLSTNFLTAYTSAKVLNQEIIDLNRNMLVSDAATAKENDFIALQMLKLRNIHTTAEQAGQIFESVQKTAENQYKRTYQLAESGYETLAHKITLAADGGAAMYKKLVAEGVSYATELKKQNKSINDDDIKSFEEFQVRMTEADGIKEQSIQRAQNREEQRQQREQAKQQADEQKADRQHQKEAAAYLEAENLRKASISKQLQDIYESYGSQAVAADQHYNDELTKLKKFEAQKLITSQEANRVEQQLTKEHTATIQKIILDFQKQDLQAYQTAANALADLQIQGIHDTEKRTIEGLKQHGIEQQEQLNNENVALIKQIDQLELLITKSHGVEKAEAIKHRDNLLAIWQVNKDKAIELTQQEVDAIAKIRRDAQEQAGQAVLGADVLQAKRGNNVFDKNGAEDAEKAQVTDKYDFEISEAARAGQSTVLLEQQKIDAIKAINDKYLGEKIAYAIQAEQIVQQGVMSILQNGVQNQLNATLKGLENQKTAALQNTALTGTQKQLIDQKYANLENAAKLKAFKADQKLQVSNVIINGAVAIGKTMAEMGFLPSLPFIALTAAQTALSVAKINSQKPAFAQGGEFKSDGKGALLPGYSRRDNTNATLRSGEAVVVSEAMRAPWARNTVSRINEMFGGRSFATSGPRPEFATGGIFSDGGNANRYYAAPVFDQEGLANSLAYQLINNFPPVQVDVKDINNQQAIIAKTQNRVVL